MFRCGCTSDVHGFPSERYAEEESDSDDIAQELRHQPLHSNDDDSSSDDDEDLHIESAKDYMERISKQLGSMEDSKRKVSIGSQSNITTVFRMATSSTGTVNSPTRRDQYPSLKHTDSESTQETEAISDDDLSLSSNEDDEAAAQEEEPATPIISILRRKVKLGNLQASTGSTVTFCPGTVFPDPNEIPQKRKRVKRLPKKGAQLQIVVPRYDDSSSYSERELRRFERRAQQNQYSYLTNELRSPSSEILLPSESFYVFR